MQDFYFLGGELMNGIKEGDIYKIFTVFGETFKIHYGYYSEAEREQWHPTPIFPNFRKFPKYTGDGKPFVTVFQDICNHYIAKEQNSGENWCFDCVHYTHGEEKIGICECIKRRQSERKNE